MCGSFSLKHEGEWAACFCGESFLLVAVSRDVSEVEGGSGNGEPDGCCCLLGWGWWHGGGGFGWGGIG